MLSLHNLVAWQDTDQHPDSKNCYAKLRFKMLFKITFKKSENLENLAYWLTD